MASCSLELVSFNARGLGNEKKRKKVFNILKKQTSMNSVIVPRKLRGCGSINGKIRFFTVMRSLMPRGFVHYFDPGLNIS